MAQHKFHVQAGLIPIWLTKIFYINPKVKTGLILRLHLGKDLYSENVLV